MFFILVYCMIASPIIHMHHHFISTSQLTVTFNFIYFCKSMFLLPTRRVKGYIITRASCRTHPQKPISCFCSTNLTSRDRHGWIVWDSMSRCAILHRHCREKRWSPVFIGSIIFYSFFLWPSFAVINNIFILGYLFCELDFHYENFKGWVIYVSFFILSYCL